jgi:hypothetical protein
MDEQAIRVEKFAEIQTDKICYWFQGAEDVWYIYFPRHGAGSLRLHSVTENPDRTITVTPSILSTSTDSEGNKKTRHGYLTAGKWREV